MRLSDLSLPDMGVPLNRLLASIGIASFGQGLTLPYLVIYLQTQRHVPTSVTGVAVGLAAIGSFLFSGPVGYLIDHLGPARVLVFGRFFAAASAVSWAFVSTEAEVFVAAFFFAVAGGLNWGPQGAFIGRLTEPEGRQRAFGVSFLLVNLGIGLGGAVGSFFVRHPTLSAFQHLYFFNGAAWFVGGLVVLTLLPYGRAVKEAHEKDHGGYATVVRDTRLWWLVLVGTILVIVGYGSLEVGYPAFLTQVAHLSPKQVGWGFVANTVAIVAAQMVVLKLLRGRSRAYTLAGVAIMWSVSWMLVGWSPFVAVIPPVLLTVAASVVFGLAETGYMPVLNTIVNDLAPEALRGRYNSVAGIAWGVGNSLGPAIAGLAIGAGWGQVWVAALALGCLVAAALATRLHGILTPAQDGRELPAESAASAASVTD